jgi:hypothetical protein
MLIISLLSLTTEFIMRCFLLSLLVSFLPIFAGCPQPEPIQPKPITIEPVQPELKPDVEVVIDGDGVFPEFLVGRWKSDNHGWEITFDDDGRVSLVLMSFGGIEVRPGEATIEAMKGDGQSIFEPGTWTVEYHNESRELAVEIVIDSFSIEMAGGILRGSSIDQLVGTITEDDKFWNAAWNSYPTYVVDTKEVAGKQLETNPADNPKAQLKFIRMKEIKATDF